MTDEQRVKQSFYNAVCSTAKTILASYPPGNMASTTWLAAQIYLHPVFEENTAGEICQALGKCAAHSLKDYAAKGEPELGTGLNKGRMIRRWKWHRPAV